MTTHKQTAISLILELLAPVLTTLCSSIVLASPLDLSDGIYRSVPRGACSIRVTHDKAEGELVLTDISTPHTPCPDSGQGGLFSRISDRQFKSTSSVSFPDTSHVPSCNHRKPDRNCRSYPWLYDPTTGAYLPQQGDAFNSEYTVTLLKSHAFKWTLHRNLSRNDQLIALAPEENLRFYQIRRYGPLWK